MPVKSDARPRDASVATPPLSEAPTSVRRAMRLIEDGLLDHASIDALCERLGIGARQLRRLFHKHLGASPVQVALNRRARFAKRLIETTGLSMSHIAKAAGFGSVRRFNAVMNEVYGCPPSALRKGAGAAGSGLELQVPVATPFPWLRMLDSLDPWTASGVEQIVEDRYYRTASFGQASGEVCVSYDAGAGALNVRVSNGLGPHLLDVVSGVRRLFDVDAPIARIATQLEQDAVLQRRIEATPGLRVPGAYDHFETAVLMLIHQHVRPQEASDLIDRIVEKHGKRVETSQPSLTHVFPSPYALSTAKLEAVGVPKRRSRSVQALAKAVHEGALRLDGTPSLEAAIEGLRSIADLSATTAQYIAMRVYRESDAFPAANPWLRKALSHNGTPLSAMELEARSESWRPYRAYAAMYLWDTFMDSEGRASGEWSTRSSVGRPSSTDQVA